MALDALKSWLVPHAAREVKILRGPFRGAKIWMSPRENLRKVFGLYEHELNSWLEKVLPRVDQVLDVGANNGYFAFGCAAAFRQSGRAGRIVAYEPQAEMCEELAHTMRLQPPDDATTITLKRLLVGAEVKEGQTTLDAAVSEGLLQPKNTLVKIDVEGAELDVIDGARHWLNPSNYFLMEVHHRDYLDQLRQRFAAAGITLQQVDQAPLPLLGRERRDSDNWWLVSSLGD
jgi:hypothetical protein